MHAEEAENKNALDEAQELQVLSDQLQRQPDNLNLNFRYAQLVSRQKEYEKAIAALERMLIVDPTLHRIKLDLALLYLKIGSDVEAQNLFEEVKGLSPPPPEAVQQNIDKMLAYINSKKRRHFLNLTQTLGWTVNDNANSYTSTGAIDIFGVSIDVDGEEDTEGQLSLATALQHNYKFGEELKHYWTTQLTHYKTKQETERSDEITVAAFRSGPVFTSPNKKYQAGFSFGYTDQNRAHQSYLSQLNKEAFIRYLISPRTQLSATYRQTENRYDNTETITTYEDKNGCTHSFELQLRHRLTPKNILSLTGSLEAVDAEVAYETFKTKAVKANLVHLISDKTFLTLNGRYKESEYDGVDVLVNPDTLREDTEKAFAVGLNHRITENISCGVQFERRWVDSTLQNYAYENDRLMGTVTWRY